MENKEKQIEEMTKELEKDINTPMYSYHYLASKLQPKGWVKLPEDSVVLSREEYEILTKDLEHPTDEVLKKLVVGKNILTEQVIEKTRNETAEKFAKDLLSVWDDLEKWSEKYYEPHSGITPAHIKERAKQFGVEIKE